MADTAETELDELETDAGDLVGNDLGLILQRLDHLLERAVAMAQAAYGPEAARDPYRGLHLSPAEVAQLLTRPPGEPFLYAAEDLATASGLSWRLAWLAATFDLSPFDLDLILIALAPEIDRRYERLYAYLQDHVARRRPGVELALNLLCPTLEAKLARRAHFAAEAPLIHHGLLHLLPDSDQTDPPLLAHSFKLDEQIVDLLLSQGGLDRRLAGFCRLIRPTLSLEALPLDRALTLPQLMSRARAEQRPLRLYFQGPAGVGKAAAAEALAGAAGLSLLAADLDRLPPAANFEPTLTILFREARLQGAILYLAGLDALREQSPAAYRRLLDRLAADPGLTILAGSSTWLPPTRHPLGVVVVPFPIPDATRRRAYWQANLAALGVTLPGADLDDLAGRFRLTPTQIADAALTACHHALWRAAETQLPMTEGSLEADRLSLTLNDLFAAARAQSGHDLAALARKIEPVYTWTDIILPDDSLAQLRELCQRVARRQRVLGAWGFGRKLSQGKGATALFAGPSGTGKTMAAEIIAHELGLDLYKIDLAGVVSKYIGETEKNLDRIFTAAENANAVLFFDEADALFGKRSEVRDSHDRYANIEISYLLQKMEQYEGIAILATNLRQHLDDAFVRRLAFTIHFPFPEETDRRRIWASVWPAAVPQAGDLDLDFMARQFKLSGGNIKNIALAAAFLAASDGGTVTMAHLRHATRREYQKLGKALSEEELGSRE